MIIYLHGFSSSGTSPKVDDLKKRFGDEVVSPDLPFDPTEVKAMISELVMKFYTNRKPNEKLIFVGTSLGAFYANYFGHSYDCSAVLVNPSVYPNKTLAEKLGTNKHYITGEEFLVSVSHLDELEKMRKHIEIIYSGHLVSLFLAKDDEVIPYEVALMAYEHPSFVKVTENGGHRYADHWDLVLDRISELRV